MIDKLFEAEGPLGVPAGVWFGVTAAVVVAGAMAWCRIVPAGGPDRVKRHRR